MALTKNTIVLTYTEIQRIKEFCERNNNDNVTIRLVDTPIGGSLFIKLQGDTKWLDITDIDSL